MTIFAVATSPLKSGVAIIRISGKEAFTASSELIGDKPLKPRYAHLCKITSPSTGELIDEAVVIQFPNPASFTGEDVTELHIHGSRAIINELLEILGSMPNLRLAEAGEFSRRAFENGKMDLTEAEGLADLIDAETKMQAKQALRQKQGHLGKLYDAWRSDIVDILANIESYIDFPDEEIPQDLADKVSLQAENLQQKISKHLQDNKRGEKMRSGLDLTIIGAPNAGKSSLTNTLAGRDVAIVSSIAGTTRDIIEVHMDIAGYPVILSDTAGLRDQACEIEGEGIKRAIKKAEEADIKIAMFSAEELSNIDQKTLDMLDPSDTIIAINKIDIFPDFKAPEIFDNYDKIAISATQESGIDELIYILQKRAEDYFSSSIDPVITRQRHRDLLAQSVIYLKRFDLNMPIELVSEDLRSAATAIGRITGVIDTEEILDKIFSSFCIGK